MRISDWSSDVCSSDLSPYDVVEAFEGLAERTGDIDVEQLKTSLNTLTELTADTPDEFRSALTSVSALSQNLAARDDQIRSEERRVGNEWFSMCRSRGAPYHEKKKSKKHEDERY